MDIVALWGWGESAAEAAAREAAARAFGDNPLRAIGRWLEGWLLRRYGAKIAGLLADAAPAALGGGIWDASWLGEF